MLIIFYQIVPLFGHDFKKNSRINCVNCFNCFRCLLGGTSFGLEMADALSKF